MNPLDSHPELLERRVAKTFKHLRKRFERQNVGAYRLYDWDIPEVRARVDYYEGHLVVAEYERAQTIQLPGYLEALGQAAGRAVGGAPVHLKRRRTRPQAGARYERLARRGERLEVRERTLRFWVNLDDFVDTGLFVDHRDTRRLLGQEAQGKSFLNLFCYTGAFSCALGQAGARAVTSVDLSSQYLDWARDNWQLNQLSPTVHELVEADAASFLERAAATGRQWDLILVDPPSFSTVGATGDFDVNRDHPELLGSAGRCLAPGGKLYFSTNHQRFEPRFDSLPWVLEELTHKTVPEDFRNRLVHRFFVTATPRGPRR